MVRVCIEYMEVKEPQDIWNEEIYDKNGRKGKIVFLEMAQNKIK